jgi:Cytochrome P450
VGVPVSVTRATVFASRVRRLLDDHLGDGVFRIDDDTVGVADPALMDAVLRARPAGPAERPTFKPLRGREIGRAEAAAVMQAVGQDVRRALKAPDGTPDLAGTWPRVAHNHLRDLVFGTDPFRLRVLVDRTLELTPKLTWTTIAAGAAPRHPAAGSALARRVRGGYAERRHAMGMYRRAAAPVCFTVSALVTNALWLGAPFADVPDAHVIAESVRLLPPSWNILRVASPEFAELHPLIRPDDDVLLLPLLSHRDPALWDEPNAFRPQRWATLDPEEHPGYVPFGHRDERCWGRHMVLPLAERLLRIVRATGLVVHPRQHIAHVPLAGLLGVDELRVTHG